MTRYAFLFKWFWYAVAALPVWLLEDLIFSRFSLFGFTPVLFPLAAVTVAVLEGAAGGAGFGLALGVWWAAALPGTQVSAVLGTTAIGLLAGLISQYRLRSGYAGCLTCSLLALLAVELVQILRHVSAGAPAAALLRIALPELAVSLLFTLPIYLLFRLVYQRVGGTKLA